MGPLKYSDYLYDKKVSCPVCDQLIEMKHIRYSKLRLKQVEPDYRQVYADFEPLWYEVWVCPYCYYANFSNDFLRVSDQERKQIKELSDKAKDIFGPYLEESSCLSHVFSGYYLMLYWSKNATSPSLNLEKLGKLWLRLSWLFHDVHEVEISSAAAKKALEYFLALLNDIRFKTNAAQDQYLYLLIGELNLKTGNITEAKNYFRKSIVTNGGNAHMKQLAQQRILDLKSFASSDAIQPNT
jgi:uncharacterized protein (DUF2225 family)